MGEPTRNLFEYDPKFIVAFVIDENLLWIKWVKRLRNVKWKPYVGTADGFWTKTWNRRTLSHILSTQIFDIGEQTQRLYGRNNNKSFAKNPKFVWLLNFELQNDDKTFFKWVKPLRIGTPDGNLNGIIFSLINYF